MAEPGALFEATDDGCWLPTELSRGPWDPGALHGGPVAALVARAIEAVDAPGDPAPMHPVRLTVELVRPVPLEPLRVTTEVVRPGRRVQLVAATVTEAATGVEVTRALALRLRQNPAAHPTQPAGATGGGDGAAGDRTTREDQAPPGPQHGTAPAEYFVSAVGGAQPVLAFHSHAVSHRFVEGRFDRLGVATDWIRLEVPVVAGEVPSGWQRAVAAADFGNGVSGILEPEHFTFVNPDLTVTLSREPVGEWVCLRAATRLGVDGVALAESVLFDEGGRVGRAVQTLLVAPR